MRLETRMDLQTGGVLSPEKGRTPHGFLCLDDGAGLARAESKATG